MSLRPSNTAPFEMLQGWQAVDNTMSDSTALRFELKSPTPEERTSC